MVGNPKIIFELYTENKWNVVAMVTYLNEINEMFNVTEFCVDFSLLFCYSYLNNMSILLFAI